MSFISSHYLEDLEVMNSAFLSSHLNFFPRIYILLLRLYQHCLLPLGAGLTPELRPRRTRFLTLHMASSHLSQVAKLSSATQFQMLWKKGKTTENTRHGPDSCPFWLALPDTGLYGQGNGRPCRLRWESPAPGLLLDKTQLHQRRTDLRAR